MAYIVSVVVPTKNRYQYLKHLVKMVHNFNLPELELVIQDNSDNNDEILKFLEQYSSDSIKYYYSSKSLTMSQNGELAIRNSNGKYVCYIGDDDGICRNIVECAKWMEKNNIPAAFNNNVSFLWGKMVKFRNPYKGYKIRYSKKEMNSLLLNGMNLLQTNMPLIYHGIVRKDILKDIVKKYGTLFPSVPPDISGSICLASVIDSYCELYTPVIINGASSMTGGGVIAKGGVLPLEEISFITHKDIEKWGNQIPPIWCGNYAWAVSGVNTLEHIGRKDLIPKFNKDSCLASAISTRPNKQILWKLGWDYADSKFEFCLLILTKLIKKYLKKIKNNLPLRVRKNYRVLTIEDAEKFLIEVSDMNML